MVASTEESIAARSSEVPAFCWAVLFDVVVHPASARPPSASAAVDLIMKFRLCIVFSIVVFWETPSTGVVAWRFITRHVLAQHVMKPREALPRLACAGSRRRDEVILTCPAKALSA